jgi:hypothetical protein
MLSKSTVNVLYTDYIENEEIQIKAMQNPGMRDETVPEIDFIWLPGKPLKSCAPSGIQFDFALACHVMEHVPNPLGWINDILETMAVDAPLRLTIPDKRKTTDYFRDETTFSQLVSYWLERPAVPSAFQICDFLSGSLDGNVAQGYDSHGTPLSKARTYTDKEAIDTAEFVYNERQYIDAHCTVWTVDGFTDVFSRIVTQGILNVELNVICALPSEFTVDLIKKGPPSRFPSAKIYPVEITLPSTPVQVAPLAFKTRVAKKLMRLIKK